jgi:hypothetical protein
MLLGHYIKCPLKLIKGCQNWNGLIQFCLPYTLWTNSVQWLPHFLLSHMERTNYRMLFSSPHGPKKHPEVLVFKGYRTEWSVSCSINSQGRMPHKTESQLLLTELPTSVGMIVAITKQAQMCHTPIIKYTGLRIQTWLYCLPYHHTLYSGEICYPDWRFLWSSSDTPGNCWGRALN